MKKTITVTQDLINNCREVPAGEVRSTSCPVAKAIEAAVGRKVSTHEDGWRFWDRRGSETEYASGTLPPEALAFINNYDSGASVAPFSFELEVP